LSTVAKDKHTEDDRSLIAWSKKDGMLPFQRHALEGGNLTIFNLTANDRGKASQSFLDLLVQCLASFLPGVYTCSAVNEAARIETDAEVMIETFSPKAPSNLTAKSTKESITIRWVQNTIQPDLKFTVWYRLVDLQGSR
jgi:immunoglobulin superfamily member 9B